MVIVRFCVFPVAGMNPSAFISCTIKRKVENLFMNYIPEEGCKMNQPKYYSVEQSLEFTNSYNSHFNIIFGFSFFYYLID